jgi:hypothetical protein
MQHAQLIEEKTRTELHSLADKLNELLSRFNDLSISDDILQKPLDQLEEWRAEAHEKIDQIVENKRRELNDELNRCRKVFFTKNEEQLEKLNASKKMLAELIQEADASSTQLADLQESIGEAQKYLNTLNTPVINVIDQSSNWSVNICTNFSDVKPTSIDQIREFKITYVRLNGIVRNYYIKTKENGKMADLMKSFIRHYTIVEEFTRGEKNDVFTIGHLPKQDFILPTEVCNHRFHLQFTDNSLLSSILERDVIVFYETPYSLSGESPRILMPCLFRCNLDKKPFGLPIYLSVPRKGCRGQDVRDALHDILCNFFPPNLNIKQLSYDTFLQSIVNYVSKETKLEDVLQDEIGFSKVNAMLIVAADSQFVAAYKRHYLGQLGF